MVTPRERKLFRQKQPRNRGGGDAVENGSIPPPRDEAGTVSVVTVEKYDVKSPAAVAGAQRVAFIAHALVPEHLSSALIGARLRELGREWPQEGEIPEPILWLQFPVIPPQGSGLTPVWVDFYIIPVMGGEFLAIARGPGKAWSHAIAEKAVVEATQDSAPITVGWGAYTKVATEHGRTFVASQSEASLSSFGSTHGDAGTAALVLDAVQRAGFEPGFRVAIIGAYGVIGDLVSRALKASQPGSILLVGKGDKAGETKNRLRLEDLQRRVVAASSGWHGNVAIHQDKTTACHEHQSDLVIVATSGMTLNPSDISEGAVVMDMTTPAACSPNPGWNGRLVLTTGCGEFDAEVVPYGFGTVAGQATHDLGMGDHVMWGCTGETIARAAAAWQGHVVGQPIPLQELEWCRRTFAALGFHAQPPLSFGKKIDWRAVRDFVRTRASKE